MARKKEKEKMTVEYDPLLEQLLIENNFTCLNISDIFIGLSYTHSYINRRDLFHRINKINISYEKCCIFSLPGNRRDGKMHLYCIPLSSDEIRRIIKLKAFL